MNRTKALHVFKHALYVLLLLFLYILQTTPGLSFFGARAILVVPAAITIAMLEGEFTGGIYGAVAGVLCDAAGSSFSGFNGFIICLFCVLAGLLIIYLLRSNLLGCMLFTGITLLARGSLEFLFRYGMWGYDSVSRVFTEHVMPSVALSLACTPLIYFLVRAIFNRFSAMLGRN